MSDVVESWQAQPLTPELRTEHFNAGLTFVEELTRNGKANRRVMYALCGVCMGIGVAGTSVATYMFFRPRPPGYFTLVDQSTGWVGDAVGAKDAPKLFPELTRETALESYIEDRESFTPETDDLAFHRVAVKSTPDEQDRYVKDHDPKRSPDKAPFIQYTKTGWARVSNFHFAYNGHEQRTDTWDYTVHFYKMESKPGAAAPHPIAWTANVKFQFHPELPMNDQDRHLNLVGMQVVSYTSYPG